jgi:hypothetical protein
MSESRIFECVTGDGSTVTADPADSAESSMYPGGSVWVETSSKFGKRCREILLSRDDALALGARLIELAGGVAPATGEPPR